MPINLDQLLLTWIVWPGGARGTARSLAAVMDVSLSDKAVFRERVLNIANDEISRRHQHMFDIRHRQPVLSTFVAVAVVPIKRRNVQFHNYNLANVMALQYNCKSPAIARISLINMNKWRGSVLDGMNPKCR